MVRARADRCVRGSLGGGQWPLAGPVVRSVIAMFRATDTRQSRFGFRKSTARELRRHTGLGCGSIVIKIDLEAGWLLRSETARTGTRTFVSG